MNYLRSEEFSNNVFEPIAPDEEELAEDVDAKAKSTHEILHIYCAVNFCIGVFFCFRGRKEHHFLDKSLFTFTVFSAGHHLQGQECIQFHDGELLSKTNKICIGNEYARARSSVGDATRYPVVEGDWANVGFVMKELLCYIPHEQNYIYCYKATEKQIKAFKKHGDVDCIFSPTAAHRIGENKICTLLKKLCFLAKVPRAEKNVPTCCVLLVLPKCATTPISTPRKLPRQRDTRTSTLKLPT